MNTNILVIGGTGKTGRRVVEQLQKKGIEPRVGSRSATPSFDWDNKDTWVEALNGIEKMYVTYYVFRPTLVSRYLIDTTE